MRLDLLRRPGGIEAGRVVGAVLIEPLPRTLTEGAGGASLLPIRNVCAMPQPQPQPSGRRGSVATGGHGDGGSLDALSVADLCEVLQHSSSSSNQKKREDCLYHIWRHGATASGRQEIAKAGCLPRIVDLLDKAPRGSPARFYALGCLRQFAAAANHSSGGSSSSSSPTAAFLDLVMSWSGAKLVRAAAEVLRDPAHPRSQAEAVGVLVPIANNPETLGRLTAVVTHFVDTIGAFHASGQVQNAPGGKPQDDPQRASLAWCAYPRVVAGAAHCLRTVALAEADAAPEGGGTLGASTSRSAAASSGAGTSRIAAVRHGAVERLIEAAAITHNDDVAAACAAALASVLGEPSAVARLRQVPGAVQALVRCLALPGRPEARTCAAGALFSLCANTLHARDIGRAGAVRHLVDMLTQVSKIDARSSERNNVCTCVRVCAPAPRRADGLMGNLMPFSDLTFRPFFGAIVNATVMVSLSLPLSLGSLGFLSVAGICCICA